MEHLPDRWVDRFMQLAMVVASWSKDPGHRVGAVIVRPDRTIVSLGYNGFPRGTEDYHQQLNDRATKLKRTVHAEVNAILTAREQLSGCALFVTPLYPCATCAGIIIQSGIRKLYAKMANDVAPNWADDFKVAARMFREAGVEVELVAPAAITALDSYITLEGN
jgi:dCMP deaminase